ncbi:hypothetical protein TB1_029530 [Malus domestica]
MVMDHFAHTNFTPCTTGLKDTWISVTIRTKIRVAQQTAKEVKSFVKHEVLGISCHEAIPQGNTGWVFNGLGNKLCLASA